MARHNRVAVGEDQAGEAYEISYPPDWLRQVKVTRGLAGGRQSTKTLVRNPARQQQEPGRRLRTRITARSGALDFAIELHDPARVITRVIVETELPGAGREALSFSIEERRARRTRPPRRSR